MGYRLTTERLRVVKRDERGRVVSRKRFYKGDVVEGLDEVRVAQLLKSGALVDEDDYEEPEEGAAEDAEDAAGATEPEEDSEGQDDPEEPQDDDPETVDEYTAMDYPTLQQTAKAAGLNAGGSADDLRARLRESSQAE